MNANNVEMSEAAETMFESFYDDDSCAWSLRRVSTVPPRSVEGVASEEAEAVSVRSCADGR